MNASAIDDTVVPHRRSDDGIRPRAMRSWSQFRERLYVPNTCRYMWLRRVSAACSNASAIDVTVAPRRRADDGIRPRAMQSWSQLRERIYVPNNCRYMWLRRVLAACLNASAIDRRHPAPPLRRRHSPARDAKLVTVSGTRLCAQQLQVYVVAQSVEGGAVAFAHARCKVGLSFGDTPTCPTTADTCGCAEWRRRACARSHSDATADSRRYPDGGSNPRGHCAHTHAHAVIVSAASCCTRRSSYT